MGVLMIRAPPDSILGFILGSADFGNSHIHLSGLPRKALSRILDHTQVLADRQGHVGSVAIVARRNVVA